VLLVVTEGVLPDMTTVLVSALVPLVSVLIGALITYQLNVRTRKRTFVEDRFNEAIAAVAVADASQHYISSVSQPQWMADEQYRKLLADVNKVAIENHLKRAGDAREAMARVVMYLPEIKPFYQDPPAVAQRNGEILALLEDAKARTLARRHRRNPGNDKPTLNSVDS
jgi:hypothetical protein